MDTNINYFSLKMNINNRIKKIRDKFCDGDNTKFAEMLGTSVQYASNICNEGKKVGNKVLDKILNIFPEVNSIWLKMGEGPMLKNSDGIASEPRAADGNADLLKEIQELKKKIKKLESEIDNERSINAGRNELIETLRKTIEVLINK